MSVEISRREIRAWERVERKHDLCEYHHPIPAIECTARALRCTLIEHGRMEFAKRYDCPYALLDTVEVSIGDDGDVTTMTLAKMYTEEHS